MKVIVISHWKNLQRFQKSVTIIPQDRLVIWEKHIEARRNNCLATSSCSAATFLLIGALIVIYCASLCLTLPGVNAINDVILPAILPAIVTIILSIPMIITSFAYSKKENLARQELINYNLAILSYYAVNQMDKETKVAFIQKLLLIDQNWPKEYLYTLIQDLKKRYTESEEDYSELIDALDVVGNKIYQSPNKDAVTKT